MTKLTFVVAALVAASAYATGASARSDVEARHTRVTTKTSTVADCVRAPNVGAFASAPYSSPPCMPGTIN
jgi:hypothetical protein